MASVGEQLRKARLDGGLELSQVADRTKISSRYLDAIERDDRSVLPGGFFYKNWVLQYAACVSLDVANISNEVDRFTAQEDELPLPGQAKYRVDKKERPAPLDMGVPGTQQNRLLYSVTGLVLVTLGCSGLYAWWNNWEIASTQGEATMAPSTSPARGSSPAATQLVTSSHVPTAPAVATAATSSASAQQDPLLGATQDAANLTPIAADDVRIEIAAIQETWLSVEPDGKEVFSGILQPSQIRTVGAHDSARIRVGNAGGLSVRLNGRPIGPIGQPGQVRTLIIDKSGYQIVQPKPVSAPTEGASNDRASVTPAFDQ